MKASCSTDSTSKYSADIGGRRSRGDFRVFTEGARQKRGNGYFQSDLLYTATKKPLRRYTGACDVGLLRICRCPQLRDMWLKFFSIKLLSPMWMTVIFVRLHLRTSLRFLRTGPYRGPRNTLLNIDGDVCQKIS